LFRSTGSMVLLGGDVSLSWGPAWQPLVEPLDDIQIFRSSGGVVTPGDTVAPATSITSPLSGATVSATTTVSANASDNVGVTRVELYRDGVLFGTDSTSPYSFSWGTTGVANGSHSLQTKAYDAAGNIGSSASVAVTVSNAGTPLPSDTTAPTVSLTAPTSGQTLSGTATLSASASDNVGVTRVEFYRDGTLFASDNASPY